MDARNLVPDAHDYPSAEPENYRTTSNSFSEEYPNPYDRQQRDQQEQIRERAVQHFLLRLKYLAIVYFISNLVVLISKIYMKSNTEDGIKEYWFARLSGLLAGVCGYEGQKSRSKEMIFVFIMLLVLDFVKNVGVIILIFKDDEYNNDLEKAQISLIFGQEFLLIPISLYNGWQAHRSLKTFELEETFFGTYDLVIN